jgi:hypothetical protein
MIICMASSKTPLSALIVEQLAGGEMRMLGLIVAVRKSLGRSERVKGDLSAMVQSTLRKLVATHAVVDADGMYSLSPRK